MKNRPDATLVVRRGDTSTTILARIDASMADMLPDTVLEVPCPDLDTKLEIAGRALVAGRRIVQPFEPWSHGHFRILVENTAATEPAAHDRTEDRRSRRRRVARLTRS